MGLSHSETAPFCAACGLILECAWPRPPAPHRRIGRTIADRTP